MRLLVTGGLGFIGSTFVHLVLRERPDAHVVNLDAVTYAGNPANCVDLEGEHRYRFVRGNICDAAAVDEAVADGIDAVVNFAVETHIDRSIHEPEAFLHTDILGTHVLLEAVRRHHIGRYLQVSTDQVYGDIARGESRESDPLSPRSPNNASKAGADLQALAYWHTYHTPVLITRGSNTYGPRQYPEKLIPHFITNLIDDEPVPLRGDGMQIRDWLHAEDHARGILHVLEYGAMGNIYNVGGGNPRTTIEITHRLLDACGRSMKTHVRHVSDRAGRDRRYAIDCSKVRALGWRPRVDFVQGLRETIEWYRQNQAWWRPLKNGEFHKPYSSERITA